MHWRILPRAAAAAGVLMLPACGPMIAGAGVASLGLGVADERTTYDALNDIETQISINNALLNHSAALFSGVQIGVDEGRVLLTGAAPSEADARKAVEIAETRAGTREVINELSVKPRSASQAARDAWITTEVRGRLVASEGVRAADYNIETYDGVVHLIGVTGTDAQIRRAAAAAANTPGVKQVVSHMLTIDDPRRKPPTAG
jgi:osmotically-inducible protein OsmY